MVSFRYWGEWLVGFVGEETSEGKKESYGDDCKCLQSQHLGGKGRRIKKKSCQLRCHETQSPKTEIGAAEVVRSVTCLPSKHNNLSLAT